MKRAPELERYLRALAGSSPGERLLEIRYRRQIGMGQRFVRADDMPSAAAAVRELAVGRDTYVGVLLRDHRGGGREAVSRSHLVFCELDAEASDNLITRAPRPPSILIASGTPGHLHAYWLLNEEVSAERVQEANRKLAYRVGGDLASVDAARILRPPETWNQKHRPPAGVRLLLLSERRVYELEELLAGLEDPAIARHTSRERQAGRRSEPSARRRMATDTAALDERLREIPTSVYVLRLTGVEPNREGKIACPFHHDRTPSLQCYPDGMFCCFGCRQAGSIFDFAAALWGLGTKGREFLVLRDRLADELGIERELGAGDADRAARRTGRSRRPAPITIDNGRGGR